MSLNCDLKYPPSDGGSVTWHEPTPTRTTSNSTEVLPPGIVQVHEGSSVRLDWSYSLSLGLLFGVIRFNDDDIVYLRAHGSVGPVSAEFRERFSINSTPGKTSVLISPVTVADDKANGEFECELIDFNIDTWKRAIQVQVIGKLESQLLAIRKAYQNISVV